MAKETETTTKTDASIATDKVTTVTTDTSTTSMKPVFSDDEEPLKATVPDIQGFTPPLRIHPERLSGGSSTLQIPPNMNQQLRRRRSGLSSRSGSRSPTRGSLQYDGGSSISSLEDGVFDILTDKMGFLELDLKEQQELSQELNRSFSNLGPVSERMSEDTLEDCHAFSDLKPRDGRKSRENSITTGGDVSSNVLEPLDECEDEEDSEGEERVKITNMERILEELEE